MLYAQVAPCLGADDRTYKEIAGDPEAQVAPCLGADERQADCIDAAALAWIAPSGTRSFSHMIPRSCRLVLDSPERRSPCSRPARRTAYPSALAPETEWNRFA